MNKKKLLLCTLLALVVLCVPSFKASAAESQVLDADTGETVTEFKTHVITTGDEADFKVYKEYYVGVVPDTTNSQTVFTAVVPITLDKTGFLYIGSYLDNSTQTTATGSIDVFSDEACTDSVYSSYKEVAKIEKKGTYYVQFTVRDSASDGVTPYIFDFVSNFEDSSNRTLKNKTWAYSAIMDYSKPIYYKVTATKDGSITFNTSAAYSTKVTLCNSSKKAISDECYVSSSSGKSVFAVKKGTYYIKVTTSSDSVRVKSTFKAITDKSGASKAKAKKITMGSKALSGTVLATDKKGKADWYKFTNTKTKTVNVTFKGSVLSGKIVLEFFDSKGTSFGTTYINTLDADSSFTPYQGSYFDTKKTLPKGTYYIKVTKSTAKTSGTYSLKVK